MIRMPSTNKKNMIEMEVTQSFFNLNIKIDESTYECL